MLCFVLILWILVFTLSLVSDASTFSKKGFTHQLHFTTHTQYQVQSSFLLNVVVRLCPFIVHSICIPNSCIFHIAKTGLLRCCLYTKRMLPKLIPRMKKQTVATPSTNQHMICPKTLGNFGVETLHCEVTPLQSHRTGCQSVPATRAPHRRSFGGKVQEHLPTDVCGILQSCESSTARVSVKKNTLDVGERATGQRD